MQRNLREMPSFYRFITLFMAVCVLYVVSCSAVHADTGGDPLRFSRHISFFSEHYPRLDGSKAENDVIDYLYQYCSERGGECELRDFTDFGNGHSFSQVLTVSFPGASRESVIFTVPLNHPADPNNRETGETGLATALEIVSSLEGRKLPVTVQLVFAGAEYGPDGKRLLGTELFLDHFSSEYNSALFYLRLNSVPGTLQIHTGGNGIVAPYWLIDASTRALDSAGSSYSISGNELQLNRFGLSGSDNHAVPYLESEIPALEWYTGAETEEGPDRERIEEWVVSVSRFVDLFIMKQTPPFPDEWDQHYLYFQAGRLVVTVPEHIYVIFNIALLTSFLILVLFVRRRIGRYRRILLTKSWALLLLFLMVFLFLAAATYIMTGFSILRSIPTLPLESPGLFFLLKIGMSAVLFFLLFKLFNKVPFPSARSFYSGASIFLFLILTVITSVVNISFSYYFLWGLYASVLFSLFQNRLSKLVFFLLAPVWMFSGIYGVIRGGDSTAIRFLLLSPLWGNLFLTLILLPVVLMFIRVVMSFQDHSPHLKKRKGWIVYPLAGSFIAALVLFTMLYQPFTPDHPQVITAEEVIDFEYGERTLSLAGEAPLGSITIAGEGGYSSIRDVKDRFSQQTSDVVPELVTISKNEERFLGRKNISLRFEARGKPLSYRLTLEAGDNFLILNCNFPYSVKPGGGSADILVGPFPPMPLELDLVLPEGVQFTLHCTALYKDLPYSLSFDGDNAVVEHRLLYVRSLEL